MSLINVPTPGNARVLVIVPTHDHHETLALSVRSILEQTIADIEIVIVGDGVTPEVRRVANELTRVDSRVRFEEHPKSARQGEPHRDRIIKESSSPLIAYNGDDDLWFPDHLESMTALIENYDFVHPLPILIDPLGNLIFLPSDLRNPESVAWHQSATPRNTISLSGVVHSRESYLRLPHGWRTTPHDLWTDHYMWQQFFEQNWFRGVTAPRATILKLVAFGRELRQPGERALEIQSWWDRLHSPSFADDWENMVRDAMWRMAVNLNVKSAIQEDEIATLRDVIDEKIVAMGESNADRARLNSELETLRADVQRTFVELERTRSTISWRLTRPLRAIRRVFPRRHTDHAR
ncbi:MAG: hypothetical protein RLZZ368_1223 [Actinomycetota bacterium]